MIQHQTTQNNLSTQLSSCAVKNNFPLLVPAPKAEKLNAIENIRFPLLQHPKSGRLSSSYFLLKIIIGRILKYDNCITKQTKLAYEIYNFGYNKTLTGRQIRTLCDGLREAGLITYKRSGKMRSVYSYQATELGIDVFHYFIQEKDKSVPKRIVDKMCEVQKQAKNKKTSGLETVKNPMITGHVEKNFRSNIHTRNKDININNHTRWAPVDKKTTAKPLFSFLNFNLEEKTMQPAHLEGIELFTEEPKPNVLAPRKSAFLPTSIPQSISPSVPVGLMSGKIDWNAKPIDLDAPPMDILLSSPDTQTRGTTIQFGKPNYRATESDKGWKSETQTKPSYAPRESQLSHNIHFIISQTEFSNSEKIALQNILREFDSTDDEKTKIIDGLMKMVHNVHKSGNVVTNFQMMAKSLVNSHIRSQRAKNLSTDSFDN